MTTATSEPGASTPVAVLAEARRREILDRLRGGVRPGGVLVGVV
jgi:hypothetical protein